MRRALPWAALGGAAAVSYSPPWELFLLGFFTFPLWVVALGAEGPLTLRRAWVLGWVVGVVANFFALHSTVPLIVDFGGLPWAVAVLASLLLWASQALPYAFASLFAAALARGAVAVPLCVGLPVAFTVTSSWVPVLFPWRVGAGLSGATTWIQWVEFAGEPILDLALGLGGACTVEAIRSRSWRIGALAVLSIGLPLAYGTVRLDAVRRERAAAPSLVVGVVQPNVSVPEKRNEALRGTRLERLQDDTRAAEAAGAEVVVWPETSFPYRVSRRRERDFDDERRILARGVRGPLVVGAVTEDNRTGHRFNSAFALDADGRVGAIADKVHLLAFGEFVPFWDYLPPLQKRLRRGLHAGTRPGLVTVAGTTVAVINCYEDLLSGFVRRVAAAGPALLVNVTNDAWFGRSNEPYLHQTMARVRAVETRRDLLRAVNTGVSSHTLATGEDVARTRSWTRTWFVSEAKLLRGTTPWVRYGDWLTPSLAALLLAWAVRARQDRVTVTSSRR